MGAVWISERRSGLPVRLQRGLTSEVKLPKKRTHQKHHLLDEQTGGVVNKVPMGEVILSRALSPGVPVNSALVWSSLTHR